MRQIEEERAHRLEDEMQRDRQRREKKLQADQQRKKERERFLDREQDDTTVRFASPVKIDDVGFAAVKVLMSHEGTQCRHMSSEMRLTFLRLRCSRQSVRGRTSARCRTRQLPTFGNAINHVHLCLLYPVPRRVLRLL